jgi:hypothetical protein
MTKCDPPIAIIYSESLLNYAQFNNENRTIRRGYLSLKKMYVAPKSGPHQRKADFTEDVKSETPTNQVPVLNGSCYDRPLSLSLRRQRVFLISKRGLAQSFSIGVQQKAINIPILILHPLQLLQRIIIVKKYLYKLNIHKMLI